LRATWRAKPVENIKVRNQERAYSSILQVAGNVRPCNCASGHADGNVSTGVVGVMVRVDHITDRPIRYRLNRGQQLLSILRQTRIDYQHSVFAGLNSHVSTRTNQHVNIAMHWQNVNVTVGGPAVLAMSRAYK